MSIFPGARAVFKQMIKLSHHDTKSDEERLVIASNALLGKSMKKGGWTVKRGRKKIDDEELLFKMGNLVKNGISANAASKKCADETKEANPSSVSERLRKKFRGYEEYYMNSSYKEAQKRRDEFGEFVDETMREDDEKALKALKKIGWPF